MATGDTRFGVNSDIQWASTSSKIFVYGNFQRMIFFALQVSPLVPSFATPAIQGCMCSQTSDDSANQPRESSSRKTRWCSKKKL
jgi:hypothetical protein